MNLEDLDLKRFAPDGEAFNKLDNGMVHALEAVLDVALH